MRYDRIIEATSPGKPTLRVTLALARTLIARARGEDSADIHALLLDAGKPVTMTVRGQQVTFTPEA